MLWAQHLDPHELLRLRGLSTPWWLESLITSSKTRWRPSVAIRRQWKLLSVLCTPWWLEMWCSSKPCIFAGFNYRDHHQQQGVPLHRLHQPTSFIIDGDHPSFEALNRKQGRSSLTSWKVKCDKVIHNVIIFLFLAFTLIAPPSLRLPHTYWA